MREGVSKNLEEDSDLNISQLIDNAVWRTAPATPGLKKIQYANTHCCLAYPLSVPLEETKLHNNNKNKLIEIYEYIKQI